MKLEDFSHLPVEPKPIEKGSSPQYDLYRPFESAIIKKTDNCARALVFVVGIYNNNEGPAGLKIGNWLSDRGEKEWLIQGPDSVRFDKILHYETHKRLGIERAHFLK